MFVTILSVDEKSGSLLTRWQDEKDPTIMAEFNVDLPVKPDGSLMTDPQEVREYVAGFIPDNIFDRMNKARSLDLSALKAVERDWFVVRRGVAGEASKLPVPAAPVREPAPCLLGYCDLLKILGAKGILTEEDIALYTTGK